MTHKRLSKRVPKSRSGKIPIDVEKLRKRSVMNKIGAKEFHSFSSELLKMSATYPAPRTGTDTTSGEDLKPKEDGYIKDRKKEAATLHRPLKAEAVEAARKLKKGPEPGEYVANAAALGTISPAASIFGKGISGFATTPGGIRSRLRGAATAAKDELTPKNLVEKGVGGGIVGSAMTGLRHGADARKAKKTIQDYIQYSRGRTKKELSDVLEEEG